VTDRQIASLLELDPDLGLLLEADRLEAARHELRVAVHAIETGPWDIQKLSGTSAAHIGLLVLDGVLAREVLVSDTVSTELLGPGDVLRPWHVHEGASLLQYSVRWNVLARSRIALLDRRFAGHLVTFPEVSAAILDRVNERALRLTVTQAISQLNRVDRRLLALFWHLAERWGRMTPEGVALPMTLSHRMLGQLVGARRPTVSTALSELAKEGEVQRRDDGTWLLTGAPVGLPAPELERVVPIRRRLLPADGLMVASDEPTSIATLTPPADPPNEPVSVNVVELQSVLERLRGRAETEVARLQASLALTSQLAESASDLRERCRETRTRSRRDAESTGA
jgi:CRP/FNR family transcriptional regulator, cyclic AMP receptor protein